MRDDEQQIFQHKPFFGQRLGSVKPARYPDRHPKTGDRFFHHHPDGSFTNQNSDKEETEMLDAKKLDETLRMVTGGEFEYRVMKLREQGVSLAEAIAKVAAEFPEKHEDYLRRAQIGQAEPLK